MDIIDNKVAVMAKAWIDTLNSKNQWRVETLVRKTRWNGDSHVDSPEKLRRFAEGCPPAQMQAAMEYLLSLAPYTDVIVNGDIVPGVYRPTRTSWIRDDGHIIHRSSTRLDSTFTLVQDLIVDGETDSLEATTSVSCSEEVVSEWHWDENDIEDIPAAEQGVTWSIQGVGRGDDGTFSYALVKRRALTQYSGASVVRKNAQEVVTVETWTGVYGSPESGFTNQDGTALSIPESGHASGTTVERSVSESEDCTYRIQVTTTKAVKSTTRENSSKTQYTFKDGKTVSGESAPLGSAPEAHDGIIEAHDSTKRPDGSYTNETDHTIEQPVEHSRETWTVGLTGVRHSVTNTQVKTAGTAPEYSKENIGSTVSNEKTQGKLYNVETTTFDRTKTAIDTGLSCGKTVFDHKDTTTVSDPSGDLGGHVEDAGNGVYRQTSTRLTDEGSAVSTVETTVEIQNDESSKRVQKTAKAIITTVTDRNTPDTAGTPSSLGEESHEKTPGGRYNHTHTSVEATNGKDRAACERTVFETRRTRQDTLKADTPDESDVPAAADGVYSQRTSSVDNLGIRTNDTVTTTETKVTNSSVRYERTPKVVITTTTDRNTSTKASIPSAIGSEQHDTTPGGLHNLTKTSVSVVAGGADYSACEQTVFEHSHVTQGVKVGTGPDTSDTPAAGGGITYKKVSTVDNYGIVTTNTTKNVEINQVGAQKSYTATHFTKTSRVVDKNNSGSDCVEQEFLDTDSSVIETVTESLTQGGSHDHTLETVTAIYRSWKDPTVLLSHKYRKCWHFKNATKVQMLALYDEFMNSSSGKLDGSDGEQGFKQYLAYWESSGRFPQHHDVNPSTSLNEFGLLDGTFTAEASWSSDSAGTSGDLNYIFSDRTYTLVSISETVEPITEGTHAGELRKTRMATKREVNVIHGRGLSAYDNLVQGEYHEGTSFSVSPSTGVYMAHIVKSVDTTVDKVSYIAISEDNS